MYNVQIRKHLSRAKKLLISITESVAVPRWGKGPSKSWLGPKFSLGRLVAGHFRLVHFLCCEQGFTIASSAASSVYYTLAAAAAAAAVTSTLRRCRGRQSHRSRRSVKLFIGRVHPSGDQRMRPCAITCRSSLCCNRRAAAYELDRPLAADVMLR